jgi:hypothetical protein
MKQYAILITLLLIFALNLFSFNRKWSNMIMSRKHASINNKMIQTYLNQYNVDSCGIQKYDDSTLAKEFEGIKELGDINNDNINDSVFVLPPLTFCEDGQSYYFSDLNLPRLLTDSYCCHPESIFNVGDIDEDGVAEIGQYYSSCTGRYKSLIVYSLKAKKWKEVGHSHLI